RLGPRLAGPLADDDDGEELRHARSDGPVARHPRRGARPGRTRPPHVGERRPQAELEHEPAALRRPGADRVPLDGVHPRAGRRRLHRHAVGCGRRARPEGVHEGGRRRAGRDHRARRARESGRGRARSVKVPRSTGWPAAVALVLLPALCLATDVRVVAITPGRSVDVVIDHGGPITLEGGETTPGGGKGLRGDRPGAGLQGGGGPKAEPRVADGEAAEGAPSGGTVMLSADSGGQFFASGSVNGRPVRFVVDTGATLTTLSRADAQRVGVDYRRGTPARSMTANGVASGWRVSLDSVRVGDATVRNVDAMVIDSNLPFALLGMSFLGRFDMQRQGQTLVLRRRR